MRRILLVFIFFILLGCNKNKVNDTTHEEQIQTSVLESILTINNHESIENVIINEKIIEEITPTIFGLKENEITAEWFRGGLMYTFEIAAEVDVYKSPLLESGIMNRLRKNVRVYIVGVVKKEITNGQEEYWLGITWGENNHGAQNYGWILSNSLNIQECFQTDLKIINTSENEQGNLMLDVSYMVNGNENNFQITAYKQEGYNNYSFFWDFRNIDFHYSTIPGLYLWNEDTKELNHLSYITSDRFLTRMNASRQNFITNDFKYLFVIEDTFTWLNNIWVWDLLNEERHFHGKYFGNIKLEGFIVEVVKYYDVYYSSSGWQNHEGDDNWIYGNILSNEEKIFARNFLKTNNIPEEYKDHVMQSPGINAVMFFIIIEHNIETSEEKIIGGIYMPTKI